MINISVVLFCNPISQIRNLLSDLIVSSQIKYIYLVDNSPNSNLKQLEDIDSRIIYIYNPSNPGYGSAHNLAIQKSIDANVAYHAVINPDIRLGKHVLSMLMTYMDDNPDVGNIMPDIRYPDGSRQYLCKLLPTPLSLFSRRFLPRFIAKRFDRKYNLLDLNYSEPVDVPLLSGCFMFLRTTAIVEVGMFDPRYFMYLEDFDFGRRMHIKYRTMFYPYAQVIHEYAKGSYKNRKLMYYHIKSAIKYFNKWGWLFDKERKLVNKKFISNYLRYVK